MKLWFINLHKNYTLMNKFSKNFLKKSEAVIIGIRGKWFALLSLASQFQPVLIDLLYRWIHDLKPKKGKGESPNCWGDGKILDRDPVRYTSVKFTFTNGRTITSTDHKQFKSPIFQQVRFTMGKPLENYDWFRHCQSLTVHWPVSERMVLWLEITGIFYRRLI